MGWRWSPDGRENGIRWRQDRPSELTNRRIWRLVRLHPVLSDKLLGPVRTTVTLLAGVVAGALAVGIILRLLVSLAGWE